MGQYPSLAFSVDVNDRNLGQQKSVDQSVSWAGEDQICTYVRRQGIATLSGMYQIVGWIAGGRHSESTH